MASEMLESERRLLATDRAQRNNPGIDHRDDAQHRDALRDRGSAQLKEVRRTVNQNMAGTVKTLINKVGESR
jgi:hypothetical protein